MALLYEPKKVETTEVKLPQTYDPNTSTATTYQADERSVDANSLVANQLTGLLDKGGDYMKRAETKALQVQNQRGLLNSSMAVGAAQGAAIDAALPIAQQDAGTYATQQLNNQQYQNQQRQFNADADTRVSLSNTDAKNAAAQFNASEGNKVNLANAEFSNQANTENARQYNEMLKTQIDQSFQNVMKLLDNDHQTALVKLQQDNALTLQKDRNAAEMYLAGMNALGNAMSNGALSSAQQEIAAKEILAQVNAGLSFITGLQVTMPTAQEAEAQKKTAEGAAVPASTWPAKAYSIQINDGNG